MNSCPLSSNQFYLCHWWTCSWPVFIDLQSWRVLSMSWVEIVFLTVFLLTSRVEERLQPALACGARRGSRCVLPQCRRWVSSVLVRLSYFETPVVVAGYEKFPSWWFPTAPVWSCVSDWFLWVSCKWRDWKLKSICSISKGFICLLCRGHGGNSLKDWVSLEFKWVSSYNNQLLSYCTGWVRGRISDNTQTHFCLWDILCTWAIKCSVENVLRCNYNVCKSMS